MKSFWSLGKTGRLVGLALLSTAVMACGGEDGLDGADGQVALIDSAEASTDDCEFGGTAISVGLDANGNGELDEDEVNTTTLVCNGADGSAGEAGAQGPGGNDGEDGEDGEDGDAPVVTFTEEPAGDNCALGGVRVDTGMDADDDGMLDGDDDEITDTAYVCSASCEGADLNIMLGDSDAGDTVYNYVDSVTFPVTTDADSLAVSAFGGTSGFEYEVEYVDGEGLKVTPMGGSGDLELVVLFTSGCGVQAKTIEIANIEDGESTVYLAHVFPGAGEVDINLAGTDTTLTTVDFTDVDELEVTSRSYAFDVVFNDEVEGLSIVVDTTPELTFLPGETYLVYAYQDAGSELAFGVQTVDTTEPAEGTVHQRFIHLVSSAGPVDGYLTDDVNTETLFEGLDFGEASTLAPVGENALAYPGIDVDANQVTDLNFFRAEGSYIEGAVIDSLVIVDGEGNIWLLTIDYTYGDIDLVPANVADATVYVLHAFAGAGEVDVNLAGTQDTVTTVDFTEVSGPLAVESGNYTFDLVAGGDVVLTTPELTLAARETYVVYAYDAGEETLAVGVEGVDRSAPAAGNAHVRGFHLVSIFGAVDGNVEDIVASTTEAAFTGLEFPNVSTFTPVTAGATSYFGFDVDGGGTDVAFNETAGLFADGAIVDVFVYPGSEGEVFGTFIEYASEEAGTGELSTDLPFYVQVSEDGVTFEDHVGAFPAAGETVSYGSSENAAIGDSSYRQFLVPGATTLEVTISLQVETRSSAPFCWDWLEVVDLNDDTEIFRNCGGTGPISGNEFDTVVVTIPSNTFSVGVASDSFVQWSGWRIDSIVVDPAP